MPEKATIKRARRDKRQGKAPSTQAGEFVREEIHHIREGKHGARNAKQAIAIGLSKARRAGVDVPAPKRSKRPAASKSNGRSEHRVDHEPARKRSRAAMTALRHEGHSAASHTALSRQAKQAARSRSATERSASARKAARTRKHK